MNRILILSLTGLFGLSCFFVGNSEAASITSMSAENGASGCYVSLTTDEDIWVINWYVKQTYPKSEADSDYECVHTSGHPDGPRSVTVNVGYLEGHLKIAEYKVKAEVIFANANHEPDTAVNTVYAYKAKTTYDRKEGIYGWAHLWSQSYDGNLITIVCSTSASNPTDTHRLASSKYRHTLRLNGFLHEEPDDRQKPAKFLRKNGGTYSESDSLSFPVGRILEGQTYNSDAYIRLTVSGIADTWFVGHNEDFTEDDNR